MSKTVTQKLEDSELWQLATKITEEAYELLQEFPEEEKWGMQSKLRQRSFELAGEIAEGVGSIDPRDAKWHFGLARRSLFGVKNILMLAAKVGYIDTQVRTLDWINKAEHGLNNDIESASSAIPQWFKEMSPPEGKHK